jgi:RHS repeat-associated protein
LVPRNGAYLNSRQAADLLGISLRTLGNGNQTNDVTWGYTYDRESRLMSASNGTLTINYSYDGVGRLIERRASGSSTTTNRLYYADWQLIAEYDGNGTLQRKYVCGLGIDEPLRITTGGTNSYFHADGLTSVEEISDASGKLVERYSYDAYGAATFYNSSGALTNGSTVGNRLLFTSRDRDPDTGWYNHRHRYYNPALGRFAQPDPIRAKGGDLNLYRYCCSHPIDFKDPSGLCKDGSFWSDYWHNLSEDWFNNLSDGARGLLRSPWDLLTGIYNGAQGIGTFAGNLSGDPSGTWDSTINAFQNLPTTIPAALEQWASDPSAIGSTVGQIGIGVGAAKALSAAGETLSAGDKVSSAANAVEDWLGEGYTKVETGSGNLMFRSADGTKSIRFDLSGSEPHINVETWQPLENGGFKYTGNVHVYPKP